MKPITVKQLHKLCEEQIAKGNGNKVIMISQDDEGNGYHYLWYSFSVAKYVVNEDEISKDIASLDDTIILG